MRSTTDTTCGLSCLRHDDGDRPPGRLTIPSSALGLTRFYIKISGLLGIVMPVVVGTAGAAPLGGLRASLNTPSRSGTGTETGGNLRHVTPLEAGRRKFVFGRLS